MCNKVSVSTWTDFTPLFVAKKLELLLVCNLSFWIAPIQGFIHGQSGCSVSLVRHLLVSVFGWFLPHVKTTQRNYIILDKCVRLQQHSASFSSTGIWGRTSNQILLRVQDFDQLGFFYGRLIFRWNKFVFQQMRVTLWRTCQQYFHNLRSIYTHNVLQANTHPSWKPRWDKMNGANCRCHNFVKLSFRQTIQSLSAVEFRERMSVGGWRDSERDPGRREREREIILDVGEYALHLLCGRKNCRQPSNTFQLISLWKFSDKLLFSGHFFLFPC